MPQKSEKKKPVQVLLAPKYLLVTGKVLTAISPFLASRFAARLFLTPYKYKLPEREKEMDLQSRKEAITVPSINRDIVVYHYGESKKKNIVDSRLEWYRNSDGSDCKRACSERI
ncbi:hypothetical protein [Gillisia marina]|uniref:hypothetical protein n=1 Tax=Gillisia marina TaxID=1167637 RepID=UPI0029344CFD|nr:hypothetical protein [Gillisia marina]